METEVYIYPDNTTVMVDKKIIDSMKFRDYDKLYKILDFVFGDLSFGKVHAYNLSFYDLDNETYVDFKEINSFSVNNDNSNQCKLVIYEDYVDSVCDYMKSLGYKNVSQTLSNN